MLLGFHFCSRIFFYDVYNIYRDKMDIAKRRARLWDLLHVRTSL